MENKEMKKGESAMETLIKIVKIEAPQQGYEMHFKIEGQTAIKKEFVARPATKGGK